MAKQQGINEVLETAVNKLLKEVMSNKKGEDGKPLYTLTDQMKVLDRAIKMEALKQKVQDSGYGSGFFQEDDDDKGAE